MDYVDILLEQVANDPGFAADLAELVLVIKARLPRDLHDRFSDAAMLRALACDARALLVGETS